jgi:hypothetical protein
MSGKGYRIWRVYRSAISALALAGLSSLVAAIGLGYFYHNWLLGGAVLVGGIILIMVPYVRVILALALSAMWALAGYCVGTAYFPDTKAGYVVAAVVFLSTFGLHLQAIQRASDLN